MYCCLYIFLYICIYIYIYLYIYIFINLIIQLFNSTRRTGCNRFAAAPTELLLRLGIITSRISRRMGMPNSSLLHVHQRFVESLRASDRRRRKTIAVRSTC